MNEKVLLILVDGMRPDSLAACGHPQIEVMKQLGSSTLTARTVMPSITLPCHMSLFHSVPPARHGILENTYTTQVRPIAGLFEQLHAHGKTCAMFHNWSELQDLARPGSLAYSCFISGGIYGHEESNCLLTDQALAYLTAHSPDFIFLYLGAVDEIGHKYGWMSPEYIQSVYHSWSSIEKMARALPQGYSMIVLSDHGGHDRGHGTDMPEDMTIPLFMQGKPFEPGGRIEHANIIDIAPTVAHITGVPANRDWEGKALI